MFLATPLNTKRVMGLTLTFLWCACFHIRMRLGRVSQWVLRADPDIKLSRQDHVEEFGCRKWFGRHKSFQVCIDVYFPAALIRIDLNSLFFDTHQIPLRLQIGSIEASATASAQLNDPAIEALRKSP